MSEKFAFRISDLVEAGPFGRSFLFEAIRDGRLIARKAGRTTIIMKDDWLAFLSAMPAVSRRRAA